MKATHDHEKGFYLTMTKAERRELLTFLSDVLEDGDCIAYLIKQVAKPKSQDVLIPWHICGDIRQEFEDCSRKPETPQDALSDRLFSILVKITIAWAYRQDYLEAVGVV